MLEKSPAMPLLWNNGFWGPEGSQIYYVRDGDDFESLAERDNWSNVWDFIRFNFKTDDPKEVNWYLHRFVGCTKTDDGKNYKFSSSDRIRMSDGSTQRGHVFTRNRLFDTPPQEDRHEIAKASLIKTLDKYRPWLSTEHFTMFGFKFRGSDLNKIKQHVLDARILVSHRPSQQSAGIYYPYYDALHLKYKTVPGINGRSLIMHECAHAVMDMRYASLTTLQSEAIAYVFQCMVADFEGMRLYTPDATHNDSTVNCTGHDECKFVIGDQIATKIRGGVSTINKTDESRMLNALKGDPHYGSKGGRPDYNGIQKRNSGPYPPVIPYGA